MKNLKLFEEFNGTLSNHKKVITISPSDMENLHKNGTVMIGDVEIVFNSDQNGKERRKKTATQLEYSIVDNDVNNISEANLQDIEKKLKGLPNGVKVSGGGYGPFVKTHSNTFTNPKTKEMYHSAALASHIGNFKDFKIHESISESKLKLGVKESINKTK